MSKNKKAELIREINRPESQGQSIDFTNQRLLHEDVVEIAKALETNKTLTEIILKKTTIRDEGAVAIADALKINRSLKKIDLSHNKIFNKGAIAIAKSLEVNNALTEINIGHNYISYDGIKEISKAVKVNHNLVKIDLDKNDIVRASLLLMVEAVKNNNNLIEFVINYDSDKPKKAEIAGYLKRNLEKVIEVVKASLNDNLRGGIYDSNIVNIISEYISSPAKQELQNHSIGLIKEKSEPAIKPFPIAVLKDNLREKPKPSFNNPKAKSLHNNNCNITDIII